MHGRQLSATLLLALCLLPPWLTGCGDAHPEPSDPATQPPAGAGSNFDATTAGTIQGQVTWAGAPPTVPRLVTWAPLKLRDTGGGRQTLDNPHRPRIDPQTGGVAGAVVFLRGLDPRHGRPWDLPPVLVEQRDYRLHVRQGEVTAQSGFVRRGDAVAMVARDAEFYALHADGAAFFSLSFPNAEEPLTRQLRDTGLVELTSAAGHFWMRAYLFVDEHPYYTRTDEQGRFSLPQVPPGRYEIVCWLPNWHEAGHERDPETSLITRLQFRPPVERQETVVVEGRRTTAVSFAVSAEMFRR